MGPGAVRRRRVRSSSPSRSAPRRSAAPSTPGLRASVRTASVRAASVPRPEVERAVHADRGPLGDRRYVGARRGRVLVGGAVRVLERARGSQGRPRDAVARLERPGCSCHACSRTERGRERRARRSLERDRLPRERSGRLASPGNGPTKHDCEAGYRRQDPLVLQCNRLGAQMRIRRRMLESNGVRHRLGGQPDDGATNGQKRLREPGAHLRRRSLLGGVHAQNQVATRARATTDRPQSVHEPCRPCTPTCPT